MCNNILCSTECAGNTYGLECTKLCPNGRAGEQCHPVTGSCLNGCDKGVHGVNCDKGSTSYNQCVLGRKSYCIV